MSDLHPFHRRPGVVGRQHRRQPPQTGPVPGGRLKEYGVAKEQIDTVIEIARHIRDEAAEPWTRASTRPMNEAFQPAKPKIKADPFANIAVVEGGACCTPTASGQSCC
jgi:hypothetical protein